MAEIAAALLAVLPGMCVAHFLLPRKADPLRFVCESIVWSLLLDSAISWAPGASIIPLWVWTASLVALSFIGGILGGLRAIAFMRRRALSKELWLFFPAIAVLSIYALILLVRPNIDWDALTYYLPVSLQFVASGHTTATLFPYVTSVPGAPNTQPPILPDLYAFAIILAQWFHSTADNSIRLIALTFAIGIYFATYRLAQRYLSNNLAKFAALLAILLPATISAVVSYPLYLDLGFTFLGTYFLTVLLAEPDSDLRLFRVGAIASAVALCKVDGFALIGLAVLVFFLVRWKTPISTAFAVLAALAMIVISLKLGFISDSYPGQLWLAVFACGALFVGIAGRTRSDLHFSLFGMAPLFLGFLPALVRAAQMTQSVGSPVGYYIPALVRHVTPEWHTALGKLTASHVYTASLQPGYPAHFGAGLILWWGFSPLIGMLALTACVIAILRKSKACELVGLVASFDLAFLTIFRLDDFRHLLPTAPLIAILAIWGLRSIIQDNAALLFAGGACLASMIPFAWIAQQGAFGAAPAALIINDWDAWHYLSSTGLANAFLFASLLACGILCVSLLMPSLRPLTLNVLRTLRHSSKSKAFYGFCASGTLFAGFSLFLFGRQMALLLLLLFASAIILWSMLAYRSKWFTISILTTAFVSTVLFVPLWVTASSPGLSKQAVIVKDGWYGGYIPLLRDAIAMPSIKRLLTYKSFDVTWASLGRLQRIDLIDATDLSYYSKALASKTPAGLIRALGIQASILPADGSSEWHTYQRLLKNIDSPEVDALTNPLLGASESNAEWIFTSYYSGSSSNADARMYGEETNGQEKTNGQTVLISDRKSFLPISLTIRNSLVIKSFPRDWGRHPVSLSATWAFGDEAPGSHLFHTTFRILPRNGMLRLPISNLLSPAGPRPIRITELIASSHRGKGILDFRSEGMVLTPLGTAAIVSGFPFLLHPRWSVVKSIYADGSQNGADALRLYPAPVRFTVKQPDYLTVELNPSAICSNPNDTSVTFSLEKPASHGKRASRFTVVKKPTGYLVRLRLSTFNKINLESLLITGKSAQCAVSEVLAPQGFGVLSKSGEASLAVYPALPFSDLRVIDLNASPSLLTH